MEDAINIRINTNELWNYFIKDENEKKASNLLIENGTVRIQTEDTYVLDRDIINDTVYQVIDIAVDEHNNLYMLTRIYEEGKARYIILYYNRYSNAIDKIECIELQDPVSIDIDHDTIYITDRVNGKGLLIAHAKINLQIRWIYDTLENPIDIDIGPQGIIYVLDNKKILKFERSGELLDSHEDTSLNNPTDMRVVGLNNEIFIYIINQKLKTSEIHIYKDNKDWEKKVISVKFPIKGLSIDKKGQIFVGEPYIENQDEKKKTIHRINIESDKNIIITPLWTYRGSTNKLIDDTCSNLYTASFFKNKTDQFQYKVSFLRYTQVTKKNREGLYKGTYTSKPINSNNEYTRWHQFIIEGEFKEGLFIEFYYFISSDIEAVKNAEWQKARLNNPSTQGMGKINSIFDIRDDVKGQFLWFKMVLIGNEIDSPIVHFLTIVFPRSVYLEYLPAFYQEDIANFEFLERFFSIFKTFFAEISYTIDHLTKYFDPWGIPDDFVSWFGSWLAISGNENWSIEKKRAFISRAVSMYKKRGTRLGIEEMLDFYIEDLIKNCNDKPYIVEHFKLDYDENMPIDSIERVEFFIDNIKIDKESKVENNIYTIEEWDTSDFSNGEHNLKAIAYDNKGNAGINKDTVIYILNDKILPTVKIQYPKNKQQIKGEIDIKVKAADNIGIDRVEYYIDGIKIGEKDQPDTNGFYTIKWNTLDYSNGNHYLMVKAYDTSGNVTSDDIIVKISNSKTNSVINIISPNHNAMISKIIDIKAQGNICLSCCDEIVRVDFYIDDIKIGEDDLPDNNKIYTQTLNTYHYINGSHHIVVKAYNECDALIGMDEITVYILNDIMAPVIAFISPVDRNIVCNIVNIIVYANDDAGITKLEFYIDNHKIAEMSQPYSENIYILEWNTLNYTNDNHTIMVKAYDKVGNITIEYLTVFVLNESKVPVVTFITPFNGEQVSGKINIQVQALTNRLNAIYTPPKGTTTKICDEIAQRPLLNFLYGSERLYFSVFIKESIIKETGLNVIKKIIEEQKPAHIGYILNIIRPWFHLDHHTYLALNTYLSKPRFILGNTSVIGRDMFLDDYEGSGQLERRSRIGIDSTIS